MNAVRTRFAPSPTGFLHVGGVRTALFAWLLAQQTGGQFILRIEDTDKAREVEGSADHIMKSLTWLGIAWDEGPKPGEGRGEYFQSQRLDIYKEWAQRLVDCGRAYADPYTAAEVQAFREVTQKDKQPFLYRNHRLDSPLVWDGTMPLRFKSEPQNYAWHDEVMGDLQTGPEVIDDFILIKSDGFPTYNFAHIVDDAEMAITHVIRGQEFVASVPNYLNLYEALGLTPPILATMPHILGPDGHKKLSKRDGAKDILDYQTEGYLPDAMINFLASLGWNDGSEQEVFSRDQLVAKFSLDRIHKSGAVFDERRLLWLQGAHVRELSLDSLSQNVQSFWPPEAADFNDAYKTKILTLVQERLKFFQELPALTTFFFKDLPIDTKLWQEHKQLKKLDDTTLKALLQQSREAIAQSDFSVEDLTQRLNNLLEQTNQKPAVLFSLIRIATTQAPASPGLADTMAVLGHDISLRRIDAMLAAL